MLQHRRKFNAKIMLIKYEHKVAAERRKFLMHFFMFLSEIKNHGNLNINFRSLINFNFCVVYDGKAANASSSYFLHRKNMCMMHDACNSSDPIFDELFFFFDKLIEVLWKK